MLYVFVVMEVGTRRIALFTSPLIPRGSGHCSIFERWSPGEEPYRFLIRDRIYSSEFDSAFEAMGLRVLKTAFRAPQANVFSERLIGTFRRECQFRKF